MSKDETSNVETCFANLKMLLFLIYSRSTYQFFQQTLHVEATYNSAGSSQFGRAFRKWGSFKRKVGVQRFTG